MFEYYMIMYLWYNCIAYFNLSSSEKNYIADLTLTKLWVERRILLSMRLFTLDFGKQAIVFQNWYFCYLQDQLDWS